MRKAPPKRNGSAPALPKALHRALLENDAMRKQLEGHAKLKTRHAALLQQHAHLLEMFGEQQEKSR